MIVHYSTRTIVECEVLRARTIECEGQVGVSATSNGVGGEAVVPHLRQSLCRLIPDVFLLSKHNSVKNTHTCRLNR